MSLFNSIMQHGSLPVIMPQPPQGYAGGTGGVGGTYGQIMSPQYSGGAQSPVPTAAGGAQPAVASGTDGSGGIMGSISKIMNGKDGQGMDYIMKLLAGLGIG